MRLKFFLLIFFVFISSKLLIGIDTEPTLNELVVCLDIGGYKTKFFFQTIKNSGGPILNRLIDGSFKVVKKDEYIFIDWPKEGGRLLSYFIRTRQLPDNFNRGIAIDTAEYFQIEPMIKYISEYRPPMPKLKKIAFLSSFDYGVKCPECPKLFNKSNNFLEAISHLIEEHMAKIEGSYRERKEWGILYRLSTPFYN